ILGDRDFRLPGLGSWLQTAASAGNPRAIVEGLAAMIIVIVLIDQLLWRPLIAWSDKFKFEQVETMGQSSNPILNLIRHSRLVPWFSSGFETIAGRIRMRHAQRSSAIRFSQDHRAWRAVGYTLSLVALSLAAFAAFRAIVVLAGIPAAEWRETLKQAGFTFLRVNAALLIAIVWTVPAGVAIGFNPRLARIAQPLTQIAASVPATALFP